MSQTAAFTTVAGECILATVTAAGTISIFSARTLAKMRSVTLFHPGCSDAASQATGGRRHVVGLAFVSGFRHAGDQLSTSGGSSVCLHVVDSHGTYYTICTKTYVVVVAGLTVLGEGTGESSLSDSGSVTKVCWTLVGGAAEPSSAHHKALCVICISPTRGVIATCVASLLPAKKRPHTSFAPLEVFAAVPAAHTLLMSSGLSTGIVYVAQKGRRWVVTTQLSLAAVEGEDEEVSVVAGSTFNLLVDCDVQSMASNPGHPSGMLAVGGSRGELCLVTNALSSNPIVFSEHWHFGPLTGLTFTADGKTLLSGGSEQVLVTWNIGASFTRSKVTRVFSAEASSAATTGEWSSSAPMVGILSLGLSSLNLSSQQRGPTPDTAWGIGDGAVHVGHAAATAPTLVLFGDSSLAALDSLENRTLATAASGTHWSPASIATAADDDETTSGAVARKSAAVTGQSLLWKGRDAVLTCVGGCVRYCDPHTDEALHSVVVSFRPEPSAVTVDRHGAKREAAPAAVTAASTQDGKLLFTFEDLDLVGLPSVLKVWEYHLSPTAGGRHILIQSIAAPHGITSRGALRMRVDEGAGGRLRLFTADCGSIRCWAPASAASHELASGAAAGTSGAPSARKSTIWRAVGTSAFPSGRLNDFAVSADGSVCVACDDSVHFFAVEAQEEGDVAAPFGAVDRGGQPPSSFVLREAKQWTQVLRLAQMHTTSRLCNLDISSLEGVDGCPRVVARSEDGAFVFVWALDPSTGTWDYAHVSALNSPPANTQSNAAKSTFPAHFVSSVVVAPSRTADEKNRHQAPRLIGLVADGHSRLDAAATSAHLVELPLPAVGSKKGRSSQPHDGMKLLSQVPILVSSACTLGALAGGGSGAAGGLFLVDSQGVRLLFPDGGAPQLISEHQNHAAASTSAISHFFATPAVSEQSTADGSNDIVTSGKAPLAESTWAVLNAEAYTCPSIATVLSAILNH